jgi:Fic family protein
VAPRQVLARLHLLAARGCAGVPADALGRPEQADPDRIDQLCALVLAPAGPVPAILRAAVVHAELMVLRPFAGPNGVVARAAARATFVADGLDPLGLLAPDVVHLDRQPEYVGALNAYATGSPDGIRSWLRHVATAVGTAAASVD